jgi:hypothetical protein
MIRNRLALLFATGFAVMMAAGWMVFPGMLYRTEPQPLDFNHRVHKDKASQKCSDCHGLAPDGTFAGTPTLANCSACHASPMGTTANEKVLIASWVQPAREIPWRAYARQPMNVRFSHSLHVTLAKLRCEECHGAHGDSSSLPVQQEDRISGYARARVKGGSMTMSDCEDCHRQHSVAAGCLGCHK